MPQVGTLDFTARLDTRPIEAKVRRFQQQLDRGFGRNSGMYRLAGDTRDFERTLGSATNRVVAFGAAAVVFNTLSNSVRAFVNSLVEVDKNLADINVNLNQSAQGLKQFGAQLFNVARETGQTFETAAKAAAELARQGLSAEETIKRLKDALVLSRISGLDSASAVETLTAAINSFNQEALTSAEVVNKFAAVDTRFAVSSRDIAEAVQRVGSTAQAAGVGIDELIALVTSLQQTTARGGSVIGNGLKTIFTRIQAAPETVSALQSVGVAIKDSTGALRSGIAILRDYAQAREKLGEAERQSLDRTVAGTFQINVLKAALADLSKQYSVYDSALKTSVNATDEAIRKNEQLNQTLSSLINATSVSIKQLVASIGEADLAPALRTLFSFIENARKFLSGESGSSLGEAFGDGLIKGIANVLSGPAFLGIGTLLVVGLKKVFSTIKQEAATLFQLNNAASARARVQERINVLLKNATSAEAAQLQVARSVTAQKEALLAIQTRLNRELLVGTELQNAFLSPGPFNVGKRLSPQLRKGYIGNFADPLASAIGREKAAGVPASSIYIDKDPRVASSGNPAGLLVANTRDEPLGGYQGVNRVISRGGNPKTAGSVPNFALTGRDLPFVSKKTIKELNQILDVAQSQTKLSGFYSEISKATDVALSGKLKKTATEGLFKEINRVTDERLKLEKQIEIGRFKSAKRAKEFAEQDKRLADLRERLQASVANTEKRRLQRMNAYANPIGPRFAYDSPIGPSLPQDYFQRRAGLRTYANPIGPINPMANMRFVGTQFTESPEEVRRPVSGQPYVIPPGLASELPRRRVGKTPEEYVAEREANRLKRAQAAQRRQNIAFGAAFALPFAAGFIPEGPGGTGRGIISGAAQGALQGATLGIFGPKGALIGVAIGALVGGFSKLKKSTDDLVASISEGAIRNQQTLDAAGGALQTLEQLKEARASGAPRSLINRLEGRLATASGTISDERIRAAIRSQDLDKLSEAIEKFSNIAAQAASGGRAASGIVSNTPNSFLGGSFTDKAIKEISIDLANAIGSNKVNANTQRLFDIGYTSVSTPNAIKDIRGILDELSQFAPALKDVDVEASNVVGIAQVLVKTFQMVGQNAKKTAADLGEITKGTRVTLPDNAFTSRANDDVFRSAALTGRNPIAGRTQRAQADFAMFNELISAGAANPKTLSSNSRYTQSKAISQGANAADALISYISGLGGDYNIPALRNSRGEPRFDSIRRILEMSARSGSLNAGRSADLLPIVDQIKGTLDQAGVKRQPLFTEGVTGITPGADYGAYFKEISQATNKLAETTANSVVRATLAVDGTIKLVSDTLAAGDLEALAKEMTAALGKQYEAQIQAINVRVSQLEGKPIPPTVKMTDNKKVLSKGADGFYRSN